MPSKAKGRSMSDHGDYVTHARISKAGEVDFPLWVKAVAGMISLFMPIAIMGAVWQGNQIFDIAIRMARMEAKLAEATSDRKQAAEALARSNLLQLRIERTERDVEDLKQKAGLK